MSLKECYISGCKKEPYFICSCADKLFVCSNHISDHLLSLGKHITTNLVNHISDEIRPKVIDYLNKKLKLFKKNIKNIKDITNRLISSITSASTKLIQEIREDRKFLKKNFESVFIKSLINTEILESILGNKEDNSKIFKTQEESILEDIKELYKMQYKTTNFQDEFAVVFRASPSNQIDLIDLNTFKKSTKTFQSNDLSNLCTCCKIDKNRYFVYGGYNPITGLAKIIDIEHQTSEILPNSSQLMLGGSCFVNEEVFVFGGCPDGSNPINICKKFNLKNKNWISIQILPESNYRTSATYIKDKIYIVGFQSSKIFVYNPDQNTFSHLNHCPRSNILKFFAKNWLVCFSDNLYELNSDQTLVSRCPFTENDSNYNSSGFSERGNFLYFLTQSLKLIRIDIQQKKIGIINYS